MGLGMMKTVCIAAPVYNEEQNIRPFVEELLREIAPLSSTYSFSLLLVNDGSTDATESILQELAREYPDSIQIVNFSANFGHAPACFACMDTAQTDALILMDSDLQDDPSAIKLFLQQWQEGSKVVYAVRTHRKENSLARLFFRGFYRIFNILSRTKIPLDAGNFSLMDRCVYTKLRETRESNPYIPGIRAMLGYQQTGVPVARRQRPDKISRVGYMGLFRLALNAIFSFSFVPMKIFYLFGLFCLMIACCVVMYAACLWLSDKPSIPLWVSYVVPMTFFGGMNLICLGIVGEYVARVFDEVRLRKRYVIRDWIVEGKIHSE